jgi:hypothetical protein
LNFEFDANGNISNYEEMMNKVFEDREELINSFGKTIDEDEQALLDSFDAKKDALEEAMKQYEETLKLDKELAN